MEYNLQGKTAGYFTAMQNAIDGLVEFIKTFVKTIQDFVGGFQKVITKGEDFEY
jgi:hypothetical protein